MKKKNVILIGMPAAGKSTIGILLAKALGWSFLDTDVVIQAAYQKNLHELISGCGLEGFCQIEKEYILTLDVRQTVIATGGSVVYYESAMRHLKEEGLVLYLKLPLKILKERISDMADRGVVVEPGQSLDRLYEKRIPLYEKYADLTVDLTGLYHQQALDKILKILPDTFYISFDNK